MQTFITSLNLDKSAYNLWENGIWPGNRLFNQINEGLIILRTLTGWYAKNGGKGWPHHKATKMWQGYEAFLAIYINIHIKTYARLAGKDCQNKYAQVDDALICDYIPDSFNTPPWLTESFASNHWAILLGKAWESYYSIEKKLDIATMRQVNSQNSLASAREVSMIRKEFTKAQEVLNWYKSLDWTESPAQRIENKWPYEWPV